MNHSPSRQAASFVEDVGCGAGAFDENAVEAMVPFDRERPGEPAAVARAGEE